MKFIALTLVTLTAALLVGCQHSGNTQPAAGPSLFSTKSHTNGGYTILLKTFGGPDHNAETRRYKQETEKHAKWRDLYILHGDGKSVLYRGNYKSLESGQKTLKKVKEWTAPAGMNIYAKAFIVPLPGSDPGPVEWKISNTAGKYTYLVAIFYDEPEAKPPYIGRKEFAVQYCRQLRQEGEQAYFHHGPSQSWVTIGSFPPETVVKVQRGEKIRFEIHDKRVDELGQKYPFLAVNGRTEKRWQINAQTKMAELAPRKCELVDIPRKKPERKVP